MQIRSRDRAVRIPLATGLLSVIALVLAVVAAYLGFSVYQASAEEDERAAALQSARQTAVNLESIDFKTVQKSLDRVLSGLTGEAKDQWGTISKDIAETSTKAQSTTSVQSVRAGVVSMDGDSAEVIAAVTGVATSPKAPQGQQRFHRWRFDLTKADGKWLVSKLGLIA